ncbi:class I SAM-dependent methyltransferase [Caldithrix abyssi]|uniref:Methyltransferase-16 n=1 Tax=Caldithrix abyssi DSM 13497 TaxID=880073 RepID=H1XX89_CALAY|nr:methyltransferase domain-containing protein [Caldithrix abyssi]APF20673.1 putative nicotinamide N-methyase [Caldithrix abyssi DSM 13497]EHO40826.1 Methyltransferase-16 [Caldithrix abyssi DSM 13497]
MSEKDALKMDYLVKNIQFGERIFRLKKVKNLDALVDQISDELFAEDERLPYWAELWPSAIGLSRFLMRNPALIKNKRVLELGVGLGLTSLVIQSLEPQTLLLTDYETEALQVTAENFLLNGFERPEVQLLDWRNPQLNGLYDCIVASDVLYEERFFRPLILLFKNFLAGDGRVIIAEPNRAIARKFFKMLMDFGFFYDFTIIPVVQDGKTIQVHNYVIKRKK